MVLRVGSNQPIQVVRLEFVRIAREGSQITHSVIACPSAKRRLMLRAQSAQRGIAASAATTDHEALRVGVPVCYQMASTSAERLICCFLEDGKWNLAKIDSTGVFSPCGALNLGENGG